MYKIGLTGPSGSGKTTLANFIQKENPEIKFIAGSASLIIDDEGKNYFENRYDYRGEGHINVINKSILEPQFGFDFQHTLMYYRYRILKNEKQSFVTDRTLLDNITYFMMQCSHNQNDNSCNEFINNVREKFDDTMTHLILVRPKDGWTEDNGSRVPNNVYQQMVYNNFLYFYERYLEKFCAEREVKVLILNIWDLEIRKQKIRDFLDIKQSKLF